MQVMGKIDQLIIELTNLKPELTDNSLSNEKKFNALLKSTIENSNTIFAENTKPNGGIPSWVNSDYPYDPENPRKPKMRELIEALSGKTAEDLYCEGGEKCDRIIRQASEMLYGVVGSNKDTRDWQSIMSSDDILTEIREQTGAMYEPTVDIKSSFDGEGVLTEQIAIIKDNKGNTLRSLSSDLVYTEGLLLEFGVTKDSIPTNLEERIDPEKFDNDLLAFLKNFDNNPTSIEQVVVQSASEVIANKISQEIPLQDLAKL